MAEAPTTKERREAVRERLRAKLENGDRIEAETLDGIARSREAETRLNEMMAMIFRGARGKEALEYLQSITIDRIAGPGVEPNALLHLEGSRYLYGVIRARVDLGKERK